MNFPSDQDFELLSAYLDSALDSAERTALEARLAAEPNLAAELESLRRTVQLVKAAPQVAPPRNFTLDPARYRPPTPPWWINPRWMQLVGTVGTLAAVLLIVVGGVLFSTVNNAPSNVAMQATSLNATDKTSNETVTLSAALASPTAVLSGASESAGLAVNSPSPSSGFTAQNQNAAADQQTAPSVSAGAMDAPSAPPAVLNTAIAPNSAAVAPAIPVPTRPSQPQASSGGASSAAKIAPTEPPPTALPTAAPTQTAYRSATAVPTATQIASQTTAPVLTSIAAGSTTAPPAANQVAQSSSESTANFTPQIFLIAGIALLVFSLMMLGLGWLRSRFERTKP